MTPTHPTHPRQPPPRPPWLAIVGSFVAGLAVNAVSDAYPGAAPAAVGLAVLFVAAVPLELRRRWPAQAPVHRLAATTCFGGAVLAVTVSLLASVFGTSNWTGWAVLAAATLGIAGCLVPAPGEKTPTQMGGVAAIGFGVAAIGYGIAALRHSDLLDGLAFIVGGVAMIGYGIATLRRSGLLLSIAFIGIGARADFDEGPAHVGDPGRVDHGGVGERVEQHATLDTVRVRIIGGLRLDLDDGAELVQDGAVTDDEPTRTTVRDRLTAAGLAALDRVDQAAGARRSTGCRRPPSSSVGRSRISPSSRRRRRRSGPWSGCRPDP